MSWAPWLLMSTYDDGVVQAGRDGHYSPDNSQILYRQQSKTSTVLKIGNQVLVSKGDVGGNDCRP